MSFEFSLDNEKVDKNTFLKMTNGKPITIERVGKLFYNQRFKKTQFILHVSCEEAEVESKIYITPLVKDKVSSDLLYFSNKSFLHPLLSYALTGKITNRGITIPYKTVVEALESEVFTLSYDFSGKFAKIIGVE